MAGLNSVPDAMLYRNNTYKPLKGALLRKKTLKSYRCSISFYGDQSNH
jgi:hypothetical protein